MDPELEGELEIGAGLRSDDWWQRFRAKRVAVPDVRGLFCNVRLEVAARASLRIATVRLPSRRCRSRAWWSISRRGHPRGCTSMAG